MAELPVLDLVRPGTFWATARNESTTTFHLVVPKDQYTAEKLSENPAINPQDELMPPWEVTANATDAQGRAMLDLVGSGRAGQILQKLDERYQRGEPPVQQVRGVVIVKAKSGNRVPAKQLADIQDFRLGPTPHIKLDNVRLHLTVQQIKQKNNTDEFIVNMTPIGPLTEVKITAPGLRIKVSNGPSGAQEMTLPVEAGKMYRLQFDGANPCPGYSNAPFSFKQETRTVQVAAYRNFTPGGWRSRGARADLDPATGLWVVRPEDMHLLQVGNERAGSPRTDTREIWTGGDFTITVQGTGTMAGVKKSAKFRAESWASDWLKGPPPAPFSHNIC